MVTTNKTNDGYVSGKPIAIALAVVLIGAALFKWWPIDEREVRRQLDALADAITVPSTDTDASRLTRLVELRSYFAPDAHVRVGTQDLASRDELMAVIEQWKPPPGGVYVEFADQKIALPGDDTARVTLTAKVTSRATAASDPTTDEQDAKIDLAKRNGDWLITSVEAQRSQESR
jgi:hypothetical protein